MAASTTLRHMVFPRSVAALLMLLAFVTDTGVRGTDDALQPPTTKTPYTITLHPRSLQRRNIHTTTLNNDLRTVHRHNKTATAPPLFDADERQKTTYNYHDIAMTNEGGKSTTDLNDTAQTEHKTEGRNDTSAFSEAPSFKELIRGSAQVNKTHHGSPWKSLLQSTTRMKSLFKETLLGRLKPLQGNKLKIKNVATAYFPKTALCNCFIRRIPLTHTPQLRMNDHYQSRNLWLFISYCNKCVSFNNRDKMVFGSYVTYQVCYNSDKCTAYAVEDVADSESYKTSQNKDIVDGQIPKRKDYGNAYHLRDGTWSRFPRELNERDNSTIAGFNNTFIDFLIAISDYWSDVDQNITLLPSAGIDSMDQFHELGNGSELTALRILGKPKKLVSNGVRFLKAVGHSAYVLSSSVLGTVASSVLKKAGDDDLTESVRDVVAGSSRLLNGILGIGSKIASALC